ncbi:hypothetical protein IT411_03975, partial [Candidatus Peregrinibacteria bacterium]|nr:hypothetical protein [Candidatus Peregrinibacteria bacterium]
IDPTVGVRFGWFVSESERLTDKEIDLKMKQMAQQERAGESLGEMIKAMVREFAYIKARLSLTEFMERFVKNNIALVISRHFASSLLELDTDSKVAPHVDRRFTLNEEDLEEVEKQVLVNILRFLDRNGLTSAETLYAFLTQQKRQFPMVELSNLFEKKFIEKEGEPASDLISKVAQKIETSLVGDKKTPGLASSAYAEKFNEDPKGFVMGFMMGRVVRYDAVNRMTIFERKEFNNLMSYLDSIGVNIVRFGDATLYDWLYEESRQMSNCVEEQRVYATRFGVRGDLDKAGILLVGPVRHEDLVKNEKIFFSKDFNVRDFYATFITPAVYRFYTKKKAKLKKITDPDLLHRLNDPNNVGLTNSTSQLRSYLRTLINTAEANPAVFMQKFRAMVGLTDIPTPEHGITQKDVDKFIALNFLRAKRKFLRVINEALFLRKDDEVRELCRYPKEILDCHDLATLITYVVYPKKFKEAFPHHQDIPDSQIAFAAGAFLMDFLKVSKKMANANFRSEDVRRDLAEKSLKKSLKIRKPEEIAIQIRVIEKLNGEGKSFDKPAYDMVFNPKGLDGFTEELDMEMQKAMMVDPSVPLDKTGIMEWKGDLYRVYSAEEKKFQKVTMDIPYFELIEENHKKRYVRKVKKDVQALVYSGDGHLIHVKDSYNRVLTDDRGKEISDPCRAMFVFPNEESENAFREYQYAYQIRNVLKVDDLSQGRSISVKNGGGMAHAASSESFRQNQSFKTAKILSFPTKVRGIIESEGEDEYIEGETLEFDDVTVETQVHRLKSVCISNLSKHTPAAHDRYRATRSWPLLFKYYFPPYVFGDKYKKVQDQGVDGIS